MEGTHDSRQRPAGAQLLTQTLAYYRHARRQPSWGKQACLDLPKIHTGSAEPGQPALHHAGMRYSCLQVLIFSC